MARVRAKHPKQVSKAKFVVDGEWLTETTRRLWSVEHNHSGALRILMEGLQGITEAQAVSVLDGRLKLVGNSSEGIDLVKDETHQELPNATKIIASLEERLRQADEDMDDLRALECGDVVGVGSPTGLRFVARAKTEYIRGKRALKEGYEFEDVREPGATTKPIRVWKNGSDQNSREQIVKRAIGLEELKQRVEAPDQYDDPPCEGPPHYEMTITSEHGWLSPEGRFYPCSRTQHRELADRIHQHGEAHLEEQGWVKCGTLLDGTWMATGFLHDCKARPTDAQKARMVDYCLETDHELPYWATND